MAKLVVKSGKSVSKKKAAKKAPSKPIKRECQKQECIDLRLELEDVKDQNEWLVDQLERERLKGMQDLEIDQKVLYFDYVQINSYTEFVKPQVEIYSLQDGVNEKVATSSHLFTTVIPLMAKRVMEENFCPSYRARHRLNPTPGNRGDPNKTTPMPVVQKNAVISFLEKVFSDIPGPKAEVLTAIGDATMKGMGSLYFNTGRAKIAPVPEVTEAQPLPQPQNARARGKRVTAPKKANHKSATKQPSKAAGTMGLPKRDRMSLRSGNKS